MILYHAWEDYPFPGGRGYQNVLASPLNPVELAGHSTHLRPVPAALQPGQSDCETRVQMEIERRRAGAGAETACPGLAGPRRAVSIRRSATACLDPLGS